MNRGEKELVQASTDDGVAFFIRDLRRRGELLCPELKFFAYC